MPAANSTYPKLAVQWLNEAPPPSGRSQIVLGTKRSLQLRFNISINLKLIPKS